MKADSSPDVVAAVEFRRLRPTTLWRTKSFTCRRERVRSWRGRQTETITFKSLWLSILKEVIASVSSSLILRTAGTFLRSYSFPACDCCCDSWGYLRVILDDRLGTLPNALLLKWLRALSFLIGSEESMREGFWGRNFRAADKNFLFSLALNPWFVGLENYKTFPARIMYLNSSRNADGRRWVEEKDNNWMFVYAWRYQRWSHRLSRGWYSRSHVRVTSTCCFHRD